MSTFSIFITLILVVCFLLILVVMVQNPKGGGLSSSFGGGGGQQLGGVQKTTDFLDRSTWVLATLLLVLILLSNFSLPTFQTDSNSESKLIDSNTLEEISTETIPEIIPEVVPDTSSDIEEPAAIE